MPLSAGDRLGPYEILSALGAGGMGEVYKARDTRLNRLVAVKVLREDLVAHAGRKQRFIQEAQAASALNHPNIVTIHDIVQQDGVDCLVMEYVAGKTLDAVIPKHGMRLNEALRVAVQVAEGLRKAHAAGIVHRDIKPSNVMVADDGPVKILDFGLAKLTESHESSGSDSTLTERAETEEGTVMGTVAYMSPEQAEGQKVDSRSDVFSFGALLYEMVSGRRAFGGSSKLSSMSAILKEEPKPLENVPADLEKIVRRCLRKDREKRYQHMDDLKLALEEVREESGSAAVAAAKPSNRKWVLVAAVVSMIAASAWYVLRPKPAVERAAPQLTRLTFNAGLTTSPAFSSDGKLLAYASDRASNGEHLDIWVQHMAGGEPVRLTKDEGSETEPDFSPDGSQIAYASSRGGIYVVPVLGGEPRQISPRGSRPKYSPDGKWIAYHVKLISSPGAGELYLVPSAGGAALRLLPNYLGLSSPVWLPDSNSVLVVGRPNVSQQLDWWIVPTGPGEPIALNIASRFGGAGLGQAEAEPSFLKGDYLVFTSRIAGRTQISRIRLDTVARKVSGEPETISRGTTSDEGPASGPAGTIAFASVHFSSELWQLPIDSSSGQATGEMLRLTEDAASNDTAMITADGTKVAFLSNRDGKRAIWLLDLATASKRKIGPALGHIVDGPTFPGMTGDGRKISYEFEESGQRPRNVVVNVEDGAVQEFERRGWGLSPSGRFRYVFGPVVDAPLQIARIDGKESHDFMAQSKWLQRSPAMSPDDRWIALHTNESPTKRQIWILPFQFGRAAQEAEWIAITDGKTLDRNPTWSPDGRILYWIADRGGVRGIWAVKLDPETRRPKGAAFEVKMFRGVRRSMMKFSNTSQIQPAVAKDKIVFALGEESGNIWMTKLP